VEKENATHVASNTGLHLHVRAYKVVVGGPEGKTPPARPKRKWKDNIVTCLREI
jgi:hypothetical protein